MCKKNVDPTLSRARRELYKQAILWIAENDEPTFTNPTDIEDTIPVLMVSDLFGISEITVTMDVLIARQAPDLLDNVIKQR